MKDIILLPFKVFWFVVGGLALGVLCVLKFIVLRVTFRRCGSCAHMHTRVDARWCGSCYRSSKYPLPIDATADNDNVHVCDMACIHYRLFLWRRVFYWLYFHFYRFFTGRELMFSCGRVVEVPCRRN